MAKKYEELTFNDDFMFCKILEQNPALCRELLELVLDRKVGELVRVNRRSLLRLLQMGKVYGLMYMLKEVTVSFMTSRCKTPNRTQLQKEAAILRG